MVDEVRNPRHEVHQKAHGEDPDDEFRLKRGIFYREGDERNKRDAGHAVGLETVGGRSHRVASVVARAVGDDAGIARIIFFNVKDDLHEVGTDISDLGENAARNPQSARPERFSDGKPQKAVPDDVAWHEEQDDHHHHQLD